MNLPIAITISLVAIISAVANICVARSLKQRVDKYSEVIKTVYILNSKGVEYLNFDDENNDFIFTKLFQTLKRRKLQKLKRQLIIELLRNPNTEPEHIEHYIKDILSTLNK